mmetsp:Transcript_92209/g.269828  ORF Transcript_92209/g.269828 Transcript_92209/m.269828 type:complete len:220 (-) Transcript_92209:1037-1696(-)
MNAPQRIRYPAHIKTQRRPEVEAFFSVLSTMSLAKGSSSPRAKSRARCSNSDLIASHCCSNRCCMSSSASWRLFFWPSTSARSCLRSSSRAPRSLSNSCRTSSSTRCFSSRRNSSRCAAWSSPARRMMPWRYGGTWCLSRRPTMSSSARSRRFSARRRSSASSASAGSEFSTKATLDPGSTPSVASIAANGGLASACSPSQGPRSSMSFAKRPACVTTM